MVNETFSNRESLIESEQRYQVSDARFIKPHRVSDLLFVTNTKLRVQDFQNAEFAELPWDRT
jgi:hypothetical protein